MVFVADVNHFALRDNSVDAGILVNAVVYEPNKMLEAMYKALKPKGECSVNFRAFNNRYNRAFYNYYLSHGGKLLDRELIVETKKSHRIFKVKVLDYTKCVDDNGAPDLQIRQLVQQIYFENIYDIEELIRLIGFQKVRHSTFNFSSPVNKNNQIDVFILRKLGFRKNE
jgi:ubiquinone/menaquinone biosynthesis C-methylase UbiE